MNEQQREERRALKIRESSDTVTRIWSDFTRTCIENEIPTNVELELRIIMREMIHETITEQIDFVEYLTNSGSYR